MKKEIINSSGKSHHYTGLIPYTLEISDGSTITVWARPFLTTLSVVRSSTNLHEISECDDDDKNVYVHGKRYYRYIPGAPFSQN